MLGRGQLIWFEFSKRIGGYYSGNTTGGLNTYRSVTLQGSLTAASTTTYYFHIVSKGLSGNSVTRIKANENHPGGCHPEIVAWSSK